MKKKITASLITLVLTILPYSILLAQKAQIDLNSKTGVRPGVSFPHSLHYESELSCTNCHHIYQNGKNVLNEDTLLEDNAKVSCKSCHNTKSKNRLNLKQSFHSQCIGCHKKRARENKKTGPRLCGHCHIRK